MNHSRPDEDPLSAARRQIHREFLMVDAETEQLERRIIALEAIVAAPWPRRWLLAARLRRDLRAATRDSIHGGTFAERRTETASTDAFPGAAPDPYRSRP